MYVLRKGGENKLINLQKIFLELTIPFWYPNNPTKTPTIKKKLIAKIPHHIWHKCKIEALHKLPGLQNSYCKSCIYTF